MVRRAATDVGRDVEREGSVVGHDEVVRHVEMVIAFDEDALAGLLARGFYGLDEPPQPAIAFGVPAREVLLRADGNDSVRKPDPDAGRGRPFSLYPAVYVSRQLLAERHDAAQRPREPDDAVGKAGRRRRELDRSPPGND